MQKITPCLWFDNQAEEAAKYYISIFKKGRIEKITHYGKAGYEIHKQPEGRVMTVIFTLHDQQYMGLNGGPEFKFNEAISLTVHCENQDEIDYYWENLSKEGEKGPCGWVKDKFGLSWQIVPTIMDKLMQDSSKSDQVMAAMMQMSKLDIAQLKAAAGEL